MAQGAAGFLLARTFWPRRAPGGTARWLAPLLTTLAAGAAGAVLGFALDRMSRGVTPHPVALGLGAILLVAVALRPPGSSASRGAWVGTSLLLIAAAQVTLSWPRPATHDAFVLGQSLLALGLAVPLAGAVRENLLLLVAHETLSDEMRVLRDRTGFLLDALPVLVFSVDSDQRLRYANRRAATLLGLPRAGSQVEPTAAWLRRVEGDDRPRLRAAVEAAFGAGSSDLEVVVRLEDPEGGAHWLNVQLHPAADPVDSRGLVEVVASDITALVLARQTGEARQSRLAFLSNVAQTVAGEVDEPRILDRFLEIGQETLGVVALFLLRPLARGDGFELVASRGATASVIAPFWAAAPTPAPCWLAFRDGFPRLVAPTEVLAPDVARGLTAVDGVRHLLAVPLLAAGQVIGVLALATSKLPDFAAEDPDLLTQVGILLGGAIHLSQLVVMLEEQRALAFEASRLKSEFLANTSHELRTPLTSILGFLRLVIDGAVEEPAKQLEFLRIAHESAEKLLTIINDVLDLARIEAGRLEIYPAPVSVRQILREAEQLFRHQMRSRGLELRVDDGAANRVVWVDAHRTLQILTNLLGNALKFTNSGGTVRLRTAADGGQVLFCVEDDGIGIPPEELERVFTPFHQLDGTTTRHYGGAGLGLTISRRLAELMGGSLELSSAGEGRGTCAFLRLNTYSEGSSSTPA